MLREHVGCYDKIKNKNCWQILCYKKVIQVVELLFFLSLPLSSYAQSFFFGVNTNVRDKDFESIISDTTVSYNNLLHKYGISVLRFPGGNVVRSYIWNSSSYSKKAKLDYYEYLRKIGKSDYEDTSKNKYHTFIDKTYYKDFLKFCLRNNINPLIQLNTFFSVTNNNVAQIDKFKNFQVERINHNWNTVIDSLKSQLTFTHKYFSKIIWEIGNEDYYMYNANNYANIVIRFVITIKSLYPNDKVCVSMAPTYWGHNNQSRWNTTLIDYLKSKNFLSKIDYFSPHFYNSPHQKLYNYKQVLNKLINTNFGAYEDAIKSYFPGDYNPKFYITEFSPVLKSYNNPIYNTQLHALIMFYYIFEFKGFKKLEGLILHGFNQRPSGILFKNGFVKNNRNFISNPKGLFKYVSPEASALSLFFMYVKNQKYDLKSENGLLILQSLDKNNFLVLNYSDSDIKRNFTNYFTSNSDGTFTGISYSLDNLSSYYWNFKGTNIHISARDPEIIIPKLSFLSFHHD